MSARQSRFEIVRTDAGWHARFRAANSRIVWTTEVYTRQEKAIKAVRIIQFDARGKELRILDERTP